jgi:vacuolar-type H+-ATPase subunit I/STV1
MAPPLHRFAAPEAARRARPWTATPGVERTIMADDNQARANERAAAETREPERAARVRADDDATTRARQDATGEDIEAAARTLEENQRRLRETRDALHATGRDLSRTGEVARDVAANASTLRADAERIAEQVREVPLVREEPGGDEGGGRSG